MLVSAANVLSIYERLTTAFSIQAFSTSPLAAQVLQNLNLMPGCFAAASP